MLKRLEKHDYNGINTAATPLYNAQPWWLFFARNSRGMNA